MASAAVKRVLVRGIGILVSSSAKAVRRSCCGDDLVADPRAGASRPLSRRLFCVAGPIASPGVSAGGQDHRGIAAAARRRRPWLPGRGPVLTRGRSRLERQSPTAASPPSAGLLAAARLLELDGRIERYRRPGRFRSRRPAPASGWSAGSELAWRPASRAAGPDVRGARVAAAIDGAGSPTAACRPAALPVWPSFGPAATVGHRRHQVGVRDRAAGRPRCARPRLPVPGASRRRQRRWHRGCRRAARRHRRRSAAAGSASPPAMGPANASTGSAAIVTGVRTRPDRPE